MQLTHNDLLRPRSDLRKYLWLVFITTAFYGEASEISGSMRVSQIDIWQKLQANAVDRNSAFLTNRQFINQSHKYPIVHCT